LDYDLVVVGGDRVGIWAAIAARRLQARVALVKQGHPTEHPHAKELSTAALMQLAQVMDRGLGASRLGVAAISNNLASSACDGSSSIVDWTIAQQWLQEVDRAMLLLQAPASLAALGIDVVAESGQFAYRPLRFQTPGRVLKSRAYLVVQPQRSVLPESPGLPTTPHLTPETIWAWVAASDRPKTLLILGDDPEAIVLGQSLQRLGFPITLVIPDVLRLLRGDMQAVLWLQALLEAEGVTIIPSADIVHIGTSGGSSSSQDPGGVVLQLKDRILTADAMLVVPASLPAGDALNLGAVGVRHGQRGIRHNRRMQTRHRRIYTCHGDQDPILGMYEATIAVQNALLLPIHKTIPLAVPHVIGTDPPLASVGLTAQQGIAQYGDRCIILQPSLSLSPTAQLRGELTGYCQLIVHQRGKLLGAHMMGIAAPELVTTIALAMHQRHSLMTLATLPCATACIQDLLQQAAEQWLYQRYHPKTGRWNWLETWHYLRRSWG
jgi:pyruvate/2-oxoglutarate dehydrogenase complex dihydrolipoamide dehydrogenase (E3) component